MSEPCSRCGEPTGHNDFLGGDGTPAERNCNLYRIGTALQEANEYLLRIASALEGLERRS